MADDSARSSTRVVYKTCSEGDADAEHSYFDYVLCGKCSEVLGTTLQENLREKVITCPKCNCELDYQEDEIEHYGIRGMKWGVRRTPAELGYKQKTKRKEMNAEDKQERALLKIRKKNDRMIRKGLKRLSDMTPEEAEAFMTKVRQINAGDRINEERLRSIANVKIDQANVYKTRLEVLDTGLKGMKTGISIAQKMSNDTLLKEMSDGITALSRATKSREKKQAQRGSQTQKGKTVTSERVDDLSKKYAKLTGSNPEQAKKQVLNITKLASSSGEIAKLFAKAVDEEKKKNKKKEDN